MNKNVRKAFDMIINRKEIAKDVSKNYAKPASGPFNHRLKQLKMEKFKIKILKSEEIIRTRRIYEISPT